MMWRTLMAATIFLLMMLVGSYGQAIAKTGLSSSAARGGRVHPNPPNYRPQCSFCDFSVEEDVYPRINTGIQVPQRCDLSNDGLSGLMVFMGNYE